MASGPRSAFCETQSRGFPKAKGFTPGELTASACAATGAGSIIIPYYDKSGNE